MCNEQTFGVFNPAKDIIKKIKEQKKKDDEEGNIENEVNESDDDWKRGFLDMLRTNFQNLLRRWKILWEEFWSKFFSKLLAIVDEGQIIAVLQRFCWDLWG